MVNKKLIDFDFKGTQGNWDWEHLGGESVFIGVMKPDNSSMENIISVVSYNDDYVTSAKRERMANINLITSSPDLLEACKKAYFEIEETDGNYDVMSSLKNAISKALGLNPNLYKK